MDPKTQLWRQCVWDEDTDLDSTASQKKKRVLGTIFYFIINLKLSIFLDMERVHHSY